MHAQIHTIAFWGIETIAVTVQIHIANGLPAMAIALGLMAAMGVVPRDAVEDALVLGELALVGGGLRAKLSEISLANHGVLFLDELAEFSRVVLDSLRQPLETGPIVVARANYLVTYSARFQLVAVMNLCRCGYLGDPARAFSWAPACGQNYQAKILWPMMDRFDLIIEVLEISASTLLKEASGESSHIVATRVAAAR
jgi:magnesium chelatase family protein